MTARTDQLQADYNFDIYKIAAEQGVGWVTAQTQIAYLLPAFLAEEVIIQTQLVACSDRSLLFEAVMWNEEKTILKSVMWSRLVHYNLRTQKSHPHSEEFRDLFLEIVNPVAEESFEERVKSIKQPL
jgi:acyl-CoA thioester hydrolase